jgi:hypothetical protein
MFICAQLAVVRLCLNSPMNRLIASQIDSRSISIFLEYDQQHHNTIGSNRQQQSSYCHTSANMFDLESQSITEKMDDWYLNLKKHLVVAIFLFNVFIIIRISSL